MTRALHCSWPRPKSGASGPETAICTCLPSPPNHTPPCIPKTHRNEGTNAAHGKCLYFLRNVNAVDKRECCGPPKVLQNAPNWWFCLYIPPHTPARLVRSPEEAKIQFLLGKWCLFVKIDQNGSKKLIKNCKKYTFGREILPLRPKWVKNVDQEWQKSDFFSRNDAISTKMGQKS